MTRTRGITLLLGVWYVIIVGALLSPADPLERTWFWLGVVFVAVPLAFVADR